MKTLLAFLLSCLTLSAATTYPVLTDSTNRLFPGGVTNVFFLNSNVVTTGTMRATGALTLTNASNVFAGDGSGLTGINGGVPTLNGSATNLSVYSSGTTNRPLRVYATNGSEFYINKDGWIIGGTGGPNGGSYYSQTFNTAGLELLGDSFVWNNSVGAIPFSWNRGGYNKLTVDQSAGIEFGYVGDICIFRDSAGVASVTSGTSGVYRDFVARSIYATNLYATNLIINGGATVTKILSATATLNFDLTALTVEDLTITVTGAADGDVVTLGVPNGSVTTSVQYSAWVSTADTVTVRARTSATGENPASGTFRATIFRH